jgi:hypothetical protein
VDLGCAYVYESHTINVTGFTGGNFLLSVSPNTFAFNVSATDFRNLLGTVGGCNSISVSRTTVLNGFSWRLQYNCPSSSPYPDIIVSNANLVFNTSAKQSLTWARSPASAPMGGSFTLSLGNSTTAPIAYNAAASAVATALESLLGVQDVLVTASGNALIGQAFAITFLAPAGDVPQLVVNTSRLTGVNVTATVSTYTHGSRALFMDPIPAEYLQVGFGACMSFGTCPQWSSCVRVWLVCVCVACERGAAVFKRSSLHPCPPPLLPPHSSPPPVVLRHR